MGQAGRCLELGKVLEGCCVNKCLLFPVIMREARLAGCCGLELLWSQNWEGEKLKEK